MHGAFELASDRVLDDVDIFDCTKHFTDFLDHRQAMGGRKVENLELGVQT